MAKGRKLTTSRSERLLGSYGSYGHSQGSSTATESSEELGEDDVWSTVEDAAERGDHAAAVAGGPSGGGNGVQIRSRGRNQQDDSHVGGLSLAFDSGKTTSSTRIVHQFWGNDGVSSPRRHMATSAPVNVPDWSKILRVDSVDSLPELDDDFVDYGGDSEIVPPHEYLAREYAHSRKTAANSVFEGVGRTLKGRDMSRVRDAVWRQTGFDG